MSNIVSVLIVSWKITRFLENSLASILAVPTASQEKSRVVDNPSADDCHRIVREKFPQVHPIENLEIVAFARANKPITLQWTRKYIPLLNPDTLATHGARQSLVDILNKQPKRETWVSEFFILMVLRRLRAIHSRPLLAGSGASFIWRALALRGLCWKPS